MEVYQEKTSKGVMYEVLLEPTMGRKQEVLALHATVLLGRHYYVGKAGVGKDAETVEGIRELLLHKARNVAEGVEERPILPAEALFADWK